MRKLAIRGMALLMLVAPSLGAAQPSNWSPELGFEGLTRVSMGDWWTPTPGQIFFDGTVRRGGRQSVRLEAQPPGAPQRTRLERHRDLQSLTGTLELRGFLRTENVDGAASLWMRLDGEQAMLALVNMEEGEVVAGSTDWRAYSVKVPIAPGARRLVYGVALKGQGRVWADDLELYLNGQPLDLVPPTVLDIDREFDAGSRLALTSLTDVQRANLVTLGKIWGFLKYHHPLVTTGGRHWDYELFRIAPQVLAAQDSEEANAAISDWIDGLGAIKPCNPCVKNADAGYALRPAIGWIGDERRLGSRLSGQLQVVHRNRRPGPQFYVQLVRDIGNPALKNELDYAHQRDPDAGYRLLALYRLWNAIEYWFPYRDLLEDDWDAVLAQAIPTFADAEGQAAYHRALHGLIARIHDSHSTLSSALGRPNFGPCLSPMAVRRAEDRFVVGGRRAAVAAPSELLTGDVLEAIDGTSTAEIARSVRPFLGASNEASAMREIANHLTRGACQPATIRVRRAGQTVEVVERRGSFPAPPEYRELEGDPFRRLSDRVAYVNTSAARSADLALFVQSLPGTDGLIVDMRGYPQDGATALLAGVLFDEPKAFAQISQPDPANPGGFVWGVQTQVAPLRPRYRGKVVVIVDEMTQSAAEFNAMRFRASPQTVIVGSQTAGADGNISAIPLPGGVRTGMSGLGVFYPDKRPTQRIGIVPDIESKPTIAGIGAGRDEVLETALRQILGPDVTDAELIKLYRPGA